ncbi:hypothetical protein OAN12_08410 [Halioglobus sp.]|nr:hypothetical protein [Halioglobus sp.]
MIEKGMDLIPHRSPMLLIETVKEVSLCASKASVTIGPQSPFFAIGKGVPAWIGIEYMGQTAALISGYQLQQGYADPHLGFLLGTRNFETQTAWFSEGSELDITCAEIAVVGSTLATFDCKISDVRESVVLARAQISVMRKAIA